ncbi:ABC transporter permease [Cocleimonas flava]|uniref:Putative ABC transport system permease protein n=1 Tax=Cocleimonas flava TaxID=634765 RepID=A0A4R1ES57_9GAMM|nr:FtsX-like permease family protein [Cocleimonas flava]TCJ82732.1 putative ABC transport system permease protein [Cocleimonas flava]
MRFLLSLAWRDLRASGRSLWIFCACLVLGVTLVSASGSMYRLVGDGLLADTRQLLGGDLQVSSNRPQPLPDEALEWISGRGKISQIIELRTMLGTPKDEFVLVELQSVDDFYPLYGSLQLDPERPLSELISIQNERWGLAIDHSLAVRYDLKVGDTVNIGSLQMDVRALIMKQPDRNLTADWRGSPVLISPQAISDAKLLRPGSRVEYDYRVATDIPTATWKTQFYEQFPDRGWEVRTFEDRSQRISERIGQIASGLLIIGFSTLFIGGLGVFSSIQSYLQSKLKTIATFRSLGLRNRRIATVYLLQVGIMGGGASLLGGLLGVSLALMGSAAVAAELPISTTFAALPAPFISAILFGLLTAFCFALPAIGTALSVSPASLFRDVGNNALRVPRSWAIATAVCAAGIIALVLISVPSLLFGAGFILVVALMLGLLEVTLRLIRRGAHRLENTPGLRTGIAFRLALANLHRPTAPLRSSLLSLGSALTLLVICTLVVVSLQRAIQATIPEESPVLVLYDISPDQAEDVKNAIQITSPQAKAELTPLVQGRIVSVNGETVASLLADAVAGSEREGDIRDALNDDHKLSYRGGNIDGIELVEGSWWSDDQAQDQDKIQTISNMSLEDREARRIGINVGDRISYAVAGKNLEFYIAAIHRQKGLQTRFWFEGIVADGVFGDSPERYVGAAWMDDDQALLVQKNIADVAPNVVTVRTARILASARDLLGQATNGLLVVAVISFLASLLVLFSVIAASRVRQVYEASVLNALGVRLSEIRKSLYLEFLLIALVTALFAVLLGSAIAIPLLEWRMKLPSTDLIWVGLLTALVVSVSTLVVGAQYLHRQMSVKPALLLRNLG